MDMTVWVAASMRMPYLKEKKGSREKKTRMGGEVFNATRGC
jgi:hypothetical protein